MCPAGELLMDHGKILNDNSSNAGTLHNGAGRNYYQDSLVEWSGRHCYDGSYIVSPSSPLSAWQLNSLQAGPRLVIFTARVSWDEPQTSARLLRAESHHVTGRATLCRAPRKCCLDCDTGPRKLVFPVLCYAAPGRCGHRLCGVKYASTATRACGVKYAGRLENIDGKIFRWDWQRLRCHCHAMSWQ